MENFIRLSEYLAEIIFKDFMIYWKEPNNKNYLFRAYNDFNVFPKGKNFKYFMSKSIIKSETFKNHMKNIKDNGNI